MSVELLERVNIVAQDLEPPGEPDIDELAVLFERAQGLGDALEVGGEHGPGVLADLLGGSHDVRAHVLPRVTRADEQIGVKTTQGLGQAVANLLQPAGQARIIEHEPGVIFDDSQALAGTVGRGVENPADIHRPGRVVQVERGDFFERGQGCRLGRQLLGKMAPQPFQLEPMRQAGEGRGGRFRHQPRQQVLGSHMQPAVERLCMRWWHRARRARKAAEWGNGHDRLGGFIGLRRLASRGRSRVVIAEFQA